MSSTMRRATANSIGLLGIERRRRYRSRQISAGERSRVRATESFGSAGWMSWWWRPKPACWSVRSLRSNLASSSSTSRAKCSRGVFAIPFSLTMVRNSLKTGILLQYAGRRYGCDPCPGRVPLPRYPDWTRWPALPTGTILSPLDSDVARSRPRSPPSKRRPMNRTRAVNICDRQRPLAM